MPVHSWTSSSSSESESDSSSEDFPRNKIKTVDFHENLARSMKYDCFEPADEEEKDMRKASEGISQLFVNRFTNKKIAINDPTGEKNVVRFENYVSDLAATRETPWAAVADASVQWARKKQEDLDYLCKLEFEALFGKAVSKQKPEKVEFNLFKRRDKGDKRGSEVLASLTSGGGTHLDAKDKEYAAQELRRQGLTEDEIARVLSGEPLPEALASKVATSVSRAVTESEAAGEHTGDQTDTERLLSRMLRGEALSQEEQLLVQDYIRKDLGLGEDVDVVGMDLEAVKSGIREKMGDGFLSVMAGADPNALPSDIMGKLKDGDLDALTQNDRERVRAVLLAQGLTDEQVQLVLAGDRDAIKQLKKQGILRREDGKKMRKRGKSKVGPGSLKSRLMDFVSAHTQGSRVMFDNDTRPPWRPAAQVSNFAKIPSFLGPAGEQVPGAHVFEGRWVTGAGGGGLGQDPAMYGGTGPCEDPSTTYQPSGPGASQSWKPAGSGTVGSRPGVLGPNEVHGATSSYETQAGTLDHAWRSSGAAPKGKDSNCYLAESTGTSAEWRQSLRPSGHVEVGWRGGGAAGKSYPSDHIQDDGSLKDDSAVCIMKKIDENIGPGWKGGGVAAKQNFHSEPSEPAVTKAQTDEKEERHMGGGFRSGGTFKDSMQMARGLGPSVESEKKKPSVDAKPGFRAGGRSVGEYKSPLPPPPQRIKLESAGPPKGSSGPTGSPTKRGPTFRSPGKPPKPSKSLTCPIIRSIEDSSPVKGRRNEDGSPVEGWNIAGDSPKEGQRHPCETPAPAEVGVPGGTEAARRTMPPVVQRKAIAHPRAPAPITEACRQLEPDARPAATRQSTPEISERLVEEYFKLANNLPDDDDPTTQQAKPIAPPDAHVAEFLESPPRRAYSIPMAQRHLDYNSAYSESDRYLKTFLHNRHPAAMSPPPKQTRTSPVERGAQSAIPTSAQGQPAVPPRARRAPAPRASFAVPVVFDAPLHHPSQASHSSPSPCQRLASHATELLEKFQDAAFASPRRHRLDRLSGRRASRGSTSLGYPGNQSSEATLANWSGDAESVANDGGHKQVPETQEGASWRSARGSARASHSSLQAGSTWTRRDSSMSSQMDDATQEAGPLSPVPKKNPHAGAGRKLHSMRGNSAKRFSASSHRDLAGPTAYAHTLPPLSRLEGCVKGENYMLSDLRQTLMNATTTSLQATQPEVSISNLGAFKKRRLASARVKEARIVSSRGRPGIPKHGYACFKGVNDQSTFEHLRPTVSESSVANVHDSVIGNRMKHRSSDSTLGVQNLVGIMQTNSHSLKLCDRKSSMSTVGQSSFPHGVQMGSQSSHHVNPLWHVQLDCPNHDAKDCKSENQG